MTDLLIPEARSKTRSHEISTVFQFFDDWKENQSFLGYCIITLYYIHLENEMVLQG